MERMEYIDLRKVGREGLKEIRRQVVRLKGLGKTGKVEKRGISRCLEASKSGKRHHLWGR